MRARRSLSELPTTLTELSGEEIASLNVDEAYFRCEQPKCHKRVDFSDNSLREWVATYPNRTAYRGYQVRPTCTGRISASSI